MKPIKQQKPTTDEIASVKKDIYNKPIGGVFKNTDATLISRGGSDGLKIYDDIEDDTHASAVLQKRRLSVLAMDWEVVPASEDQKDVEAAEFIDDLLKKLSFDQICLDLLDAILKGFSVSEIMWIIEDGKLTVQNIFSRDQRRFLFDEESKLRLKTPTNQTQGELMPDNKFIVHRFGGKSGNLYGRGIGSKLFWPVYFKRQGISFWLVFCEKFGTPTAVGKYPQGMPEEDQNNLLHSLEEIAQNAAVVVPQGCEISFLEPVRSGVTTYEQLCRYMDEQISEAVLGETLSTNIGDAGSKAAADTHNGVRLEISQADADLLSDTLKRDLFTPLVMFNFPNAEVPTLRRFIAIPESVKDDALNKKADWLTKIYSIGIEPEDPKAFYAENFGGQWTSLKLDPNALPAGGRTEFSARGRMEFAEKNMELSDQLELLSRPLTDKWIDEIKHLLQSCQSLEEFQDKLLNLYGNLDIDELSNVMQAALEVANLSGRSEV